MNSTYKILLFSVLSLVPAVAKSVNFFDADFEQEGWVEDTSSKLLDNMREFIAAGQLTEEQIRDLTAPLAVRPALIHAVDELAWPAARLLLESSSVLSGFLLFLLRDELPALRAAVIGLNERNVEDLLVDLNVPAQLQDVFLQNPFFNNGDQLRNFVAMRHQLNIVNHLPFADIQARGEPYKQALYGLLYYVSCGAELGTEEMRVCLGAENGSRDLFVALKAKLIPLFAPLAVPAAPEGDENIRMNFWVLDAIVRALGAALLE